MRNRSLLLALLAMAGCAPIGAQEAGQAGIMPTSLAGPVSYEARSWGQIMLRWQVNPDGTGEIWRKTEFKDTAAIRKYRLRLSGAALRTFVIRAEEARAAVRGGVACKKDIFDLPYGTMTWDYPGARQDYHFDAGCRSAQSDAAMARLAAADAAVETLASIDADPYVVEPAGAR